MSPLQFIRDDFKALTYCKWKGHRVSNETLDRLKEKNMSEGEAECTECRWPVIVRRDPDDSKHWFVSED